MNNDQNCSDCTHKHDCKTVYKAMGRSDQPNVAWKVIFAFVVPLLVFAGSIAGLGVVFERIVESESLQTLLTFLSAVGITAMTAWIIRTIQSGTCRCEDLSDGHNGKNDVSGRGASAGE